MTASDTLSLDYGWVYDANGYSDISKVDFWVQRADGSFIDVADATTFSAYAYDNNWAGFNYSLGLSSLSLGAGTTTLWANAYDKSGNSTGWLTTSFSVSATDDWYKTNLKDAGIITKTQSLAADGSLSRNDIISIFRDAEDGGTVDANELTDFRTILTNSSRFAIEDYVKVLANKVANSDPANTRSGFGNLYAGSSSTQLGNLIGKWFLGTDRPTTQYQYRTASGSLYQNGISYQDIDQGILGDCYLLAGLAGIASRTPSAIQNMFTDNGDGTYAVRFYNNGVADYVTVDRQLPTDAAGHFVYANRDRGLLYNNSANELWVALAEKAYAQINQSGWIGQNNTNSYSGIEGGWSDTVLRQITNQSSTYDSSLTDSDRTNIINQFNAGRTVYMNWADHALTLVGYNSSTQQFSIYNPWGTLYNLTWSQILNGGYGGERFTDWSYSV